MPVSLSAAARVAPLVMPAILGACAVLPDSGPAVAPKPVTGYATERSFATPEGNWPADRWWMSWGDPALDGLLTEALAGQPTLKEAAARLAKAEANAQVTFGGVAWIAVTTVYRSMANTDMGYWDISLPIVALGFGLPFFFVPLSLLILGSVEEGEVASAAGLMNFLRTIAGAFATSVVNTAREDGIKAARADLVAISDRGGETLATLTASTGSLETARATLERMIEPQAAMLATNEVMAVTGVIIAIAAVSVWLAPRPAHQVDLSQAH